MLLLVCTHGHQISLIQQDVRCHQNGIGKQAGGDVVSVLLGLLLELGHAGELAELGIAAQDPAQLCVLGHMALDEQNALFGIQTAGQILCQLGQGTAAQVSRVLADGDGVHIHYAVDALVLVLQGYPVLDGAHVGAQSQVAAGLDAAENSLLPHVVFHDLLLRSMPPERSGAVLFLFRIPARRTAPQKNWLSNVLYHIIRKVQRCFRSERTLLQNDTG